MLDSDWLIAVIFSTTSDLALWICRIFTCICIIINLFFMVFAKSYLPFLPFTETLVTKLVKRFQLCVLCNLIRIGTGISPLSTGIFRKYPSQTWCICKKYFRVFMNDQFVFCMDCSFSRPLKSKYNLVSYHFVIYNRTRERKKTHLHTTSDINYIRYQQYCKIIWRPLFFLHKKLSMSFIWGILWTVWPLH